MKKRFKKTNVSKKQLKISVISIRRGSAKEQILRDRLWASQVAIAMRARWNPSFRFFGGTTTTAGNEFRLYGCAFKPEVCVCPRPRRRRPAKLWFRKGCGEMI